MKSHIVLVPGAWHSGDAYDTLLPSLHSHGYQTTALTLPSVGAEPPLSSLDLEVDYIRGKIVPLLEQGQDVVMVMHSYGGFAGSAALRGLSKTEREEHGQSGGVTSLVYLAAWMLDMGKAIRGSGGATGGKLGPSVLHEEGDYIYHRNPIPAFYQDVDPQLATLCASRLRHHSLPMFYIPQPYAAWQHIPSTYLLCTEDRTIVYERQLLLIEDAKVPIKTFTCNAGHSPFLGQPEFTSKVIRHAAGESIDVS